MGHFRPYRKRPTAWVSGLPQPATFERFTDADLISYQPR
jgi:hypothetical protein